MKCQPSSVCPSNTLECSRYLVCEEAISRRGLRTQQSSPAHLTSNEYITRASSNLSIERKRTSLRLIRQHHPTCGQHTFSSSNPSSTISFVNWMLCMPGQGIWQASAHRSRQQPRWGCPRFDRNRAIMQSNVQGRSIRLPLRSGMPLLRMVTIQLRQLQGPKHSSTIRTSTNSLMDRAKDMKMLNTESLRL